jgi:hypothetical protein
MATMRTTHQTVTFTRPFSLSGLDGAQPAGAYTVEADDELLQTLSFPAHRRLETRIRLPGDGSGAGFEQVACVDPAELDEALARDAAEAAAATERRAPTSAPRATTPMSTGRTAVGSTGSFVATIPPTGTPSPWARRAPGGWLALNLPELKLIALLLGGMCVLGILMSFDLPLS